MSLLTRPLTSSLENSSLKDHFTPDGNFPAVVVKSESVPDLSSIGIKIDPDHNENGVSFSNETADCKSNILPEGVIFNLVPSTHSTKTKLSSKHFNLFQTYIETQEMKIITRELVPNQTVNLKTKVKEEKTFLEHSQNSVKHELERSIRNKPLVNMLKLEEPDDSANTNQPLYQGKELRVVLQDIFQRKISNERTVHSNEKRCLCIFCLGNVKVKKRLSGDFELNSVSKPRERLIISGSPLSARNFSVVYNSQTKVQSSSCFKKNVNSFHCNLCPEKFQFQHLLSAHFKIAHPFEKPYSCKQCLKKFKNEFSLNRHVIIHSANRPFTCLHCSATYKRKSHLQLHLTIHGDQKFLPCPHCPATFRLPLYLRNHLLRHDAKKFECAHCSSKFHAKSDLLKHLAIHSPARPYACSQCPAKFKRRSNWQTHEKTHTKEKLFSCADCGVNTKTKWQLAEHMAIHSKEKPFSCTQCSKKFASKGRLQRHLPNHSEVKRFSCAQCSFKTKMKVNLSKHLFSHTNEKPWVCKLCPKKFKRESQLNSHIAKCHSEYRPYSCKRCPKAFFHRWECDRHEKKHINGKMFSCALCTAKFYDKSGVEVHLKYTHSTEKPFSCPLCSVKFKTKWNAELHLKRHSKKK